MIDKLCLILMPWRYVSINRVPEMWNVSRPYACKRIAADGIPVLTSCYGLRLYILKSDAIRIRDELRRQRDEGLESLSEFNRLYAE